MGVAMPLAGSFVAQSSSPASLSKARNFPLKAWPCRRGDDGQKFSTKTNSAVKGRYPCRVSRLLVGSNGWPLAGVLPLISVQLPRLAALDEWSPTRKQSSAVTLRKSAVNWPWSRRPDKWPPRGGAPGNCRQQIFTTDNPGYSYETSLSVPAGKGWACRPEV